MTPHDLKHTLSSLGLSQVGAAALLGVTDRLVRMWVAGDVPVADWAAKVLRLMAAGKLSQDDWRDA